MPGDEEAPMDGDVLERLRERLAANRAGGGEDKIDRQHEQGKLTARERIEQLLDEEPSGRSGCTYH